MNFFLSIYSTFIHIQNPSLVWSPFYRSLTFLLSNSLTRFLFITTNFVCELIATLQNPSGYWGAHNDLQAER